MQHADDIAKETGTPRLTGRIHILGLGNLGTFVAHSLASRQSPPPMTLLLHHRNSYRSWVSKKGCLAVRSNGLDDIKAGFNINVKVHHKWYSLPYWDQGSAAAELGENIEEGSKELTKRTLAEGDENVDTIECVIVVVKAPQTVNALWSIKHRLTCDSTILLLQNGVGIIEELNANVFPDPLKRPHYMVGVVSHGLTTNGPFHVDHTGVGTIILSPVPSRDAVAPANDKDADWAPTTKYLLRTMTLTPQLVAFAETPASILQFQLEKLAINAVINPLTALLECKNGELLYNYKATRAMRLILIEISSVICALPELQGIPGIETRFSPERLRHLVVRVANKTSKNTSSMLHDIFRGNVTEVKYINGYIVRRGEELGIKCVVNYMIQQLVQAKEEVQKGRESAAVPMDTDFEMDK